MRKLDRSTQFKKDFKREKRGKRRASLDADLRTVIELLVQDSPLPVSCEDHALAGEWKEFRDCHVYPDLILIYRKKGKSSLQLVRLGSHAELGL